MYSAQLGRFCSRDPIATRGDMEDYLYVGGSPVTYTDPNGWQRLATSQTTDVLDIDNSCNPSESDCIRRAGQRLQERTNQQCFAPETADRTTEECRANLAECVLETLRYVRIKCQKRNTGVCQSTYKAVADGACVDSKKFALYTDCQCGYIADKKGQIRLSDPTCVACDPSTLRDSSIVFCYPGTFPRPRISGGTWCDTWLHAVTERLLHEALHHCVGPHTPFNEGKKDRCNRPEVDILIRDYRRNCGFR